MHSFSPEWETVRCHLCSGSGAAQPLLLHGQPLRQGQYGYELHPVICQCGLVFLNPRWSAATYNDFYTNHYDALYRLEIKPDYGKQGVRNNMRQVWGRVEPHLQRSAINNVLDAGCGSGYGLQFLQEELPQARMAGIEASPECCRILQDDVGADLLDSDVDGPWVESHQGRFDLIVMRHVVEHFLTPVETLRRLQTALAPGGTIYIAVPDMMHPRTVLRDYDKWWEYWFRAVHPYYYCRETLFATLALAGLAPLAWGDENEEVWCLAATASQPAAIEAAVPPQLRWTQQDLLDKLLP